MRARLKPIPEPSDEALVKHDTATSGLAAGGTPAAGRTTLDEARRKGLVGWLQRTAAPFEEIWNLQKPADGSSGWLLAGIQQLS